MIGIEQEYVLLDRRGQVQHQAPEFLQALGPRFPFEHHRCQVEHNSHPGSIEDVLDELRGQRARLQERAKEVGLQLHAAPWAPYPRPEMGQVQAEHFHFEARTPQEKLRVYRRICAVVPVLRKLARHDAQFMGGTGGDRMSGNPNVGDPPTLSLDDVKRGNVPGLDPVKSRHFDVTPFATTGCTVEVRFPDMHPDFSRTEALARVLRHVAETGATGSIASLAEDAGISLRPYQGTPDYPTSKKWVEEKREAYEEISGTSHLAWIAKSIVKPQAIPETANDGMAGLQYMDALAQTGGDFSHLRNHFLKKPPSDWPTDPYAVVLAHRSGLHRTLMKPVLERLRNATLHDPTSAMEALARYRIPIPNHWRARPGPAGEFTDWMLGKPWGGSLPDDPIWRLRFLDLGPTN